MNPYFTRRLSPREQLQAQYVSVTHSGSELCRTDAAHKAERLARALALLDLVESGQASIEMIKDASD